MNEDRFLYCRICADVHHITPFDQTPIYDLEDMTVRETATDDRRSFLDQHAEHGIEALISRAEKHFYGGQFVDPMKVGYVEVTNGQESFILRVSRRNITKPVSYKLVSRQIMLWEITNDGE
jgi:hypothetical protein